MSEEEIIKECEELIIEINSHKDKDFIGRLYYKNRPIEELLKGLLDLYNQQKQQTIKLQAINEEHKKENGELIKVIKQEGELRKELEQEKEKNETLESLLQGNLYALYLYYKQSTIEREEELINSVSKDKIRNFIKEETKEGTYNFVTLSAEKLKKLLEED